MWRGGSLRENPALVRMLGYKSGDNWRLELPGFASFTPSRAQAAAFYELLLTRKVVEGFETRWRCRMET